MLQNRVDPNGYIIKNESPGLLDGEPRCFCTTMPQENFAPVNITGMDYLPGLSLKAGKRPIMAPDRWTELFSSTKPPHLPQVTDPVANVGERIFYRLNSSG